MSEDTHCSFVLDDEWREKHALYIQIDDEVADESGNWQCLRRAGDGNEYCIFHQNPEDREQNGVSDAEVAQAFVDAVHGTSQQWAIVGADEMTARVRARREKQFLGATLGNLQLPYQVLSASDRYPIDLRGTTINELNLRNAEITHDLYLTGMQAATINFIELNAKSNIIFNGATVKDKVWLNEVIIEGSVLFGWTAVEGSVSLDKAMVEGGVALKGAGIKGSISSKGATVKDWISLDEATIGGSVSFEWTTVEDWIRLNEATIGGSVSFTEATVEGWITLDEATIGGSVSVDHIGLERVSAWREYATHPSRQRTQRRTPG